MNDQTSRESTTSKGNNSLETRELRIVDDSGGARLVLRMESGNPTFRLLRADGVSAVSIIIDAGGHPSVQLSNPSSKGPTASLEVDDKGAHVKFDRPGGASSYLFLNNAGESGVVLIDNTATRRLSVLLPPDGDPVVQRFSALGKPIP